MKIKYLIFSSFLLLNGCAMMSKNECLSANWEFIGQQDGISGAGSLAQKRTTVCAKHNVVMDRALYAEGYKKGVRTYCSPEAVFEYALHGKGDYKSCPLEMHNILRPYYIVANNYYDSKSNLEAIEYKIAQAKSRLTQADSREMVDYYRGIIIKNSELRRQAERNFTQSENELSIFKKNSF